MQTCCSLKPCVNIPPHIIKLNSYKNKNKKGLHVDALHYVVYYTVQTCPISKASLQFCTV